MPENEEKNALDIALDYEKRKAALERPYISIGRAAANIVIPLLVAAGLFCLLYFTLPVYRLGISLGVSIGSLALYAIIRLKAIALWCIRVYQATAPDEVRLKCVFTPSCSQYAVAAIEKYGLMRALPKIVRRLKRCHPPNGGVDDLE